MSSPLARSAARQANQINANAIAAAAALADRIEGGLQAGVDGFGSAPAPADVSSESAKIAQSLVGEMAGALNRLASTVDYPAIGPASAVAACGGGGGGDPTIGAPATRSSYVGNGADGRLIVTGLVSITRLYILRVPLGVFVTNGWWTDGATVQEIVDGAPVWAASAQLIPFAGGTYTVDASADGPNQVGATYAYVAWS